MTDAAAEWMRLRAAGLLGDPDVFTPLEGAGLPAWLPQPVTLEKIFADGSILRWFDRGGRWKHYDSARALELAKWKGEA